MKTALSRLLIVSAFTALTASCVTSGRTGIPPGAYHGYEKYKKAGHYKALSVAKGKRGGYVWAYSSKKLSVEEAINMAEENCRKVLGRHINLYVSTYCRLHSVGDVQVLDMDKSELEKVISKYKGRTTQNARLNNLSDYWICKNALDSRDGYSSWDTRSTDFMNEAIQRGFNINDCRRLAR